MDNPQGRIQSLIRDGDGVHAIVGIDVAAVCPRCASGKGCGAGIVAGAKGPRKVEATVPPDMELHEGDLVEVALAPENLLQAASIVYGLPMLGAILGAAGAYVFGLGEVAAALAALAGLGAGLFAARRRLRQVSCLTRFTPSVHRRVPDTARAGG